MFGRMFAPSCDGAAAVGPQGRGGARAQRARRHLRARQPAARRAVARPAARPARVPVSRAPQRRRRADRPHGREGLRRQHRADRQRPPPHLQGADRLVEPARARAGRGLRRQARQPRADPLRQQPGAWWRRGWRSTKAGAVAVNTMPMLRAGELGKIVDKAEVSLALTDSRIADELVACAKDSRFLKKVDQLRRHRQPRCRARPRRARASRQVRGGARPAATTSRCWASPPAPPASPRAPCTSTATC